MPDSKPTDELERKLFKRQRVLLAWTVTLSIYAATVCGIALHTLIVRTDWSGLSLGEMGSWVILALIVTPFIVIAHLIALATVRSVARLRSPGRRPVTRDHLLAGIIPAMMIVLPLVPAALDRANPARIFHRLTGHQAPENARVIAYENSSSVVEDVLQITFQADPQKMRELLEEMGFKDHQSHGTQKFSPVQLRGDVGRITIHWDHHMMVFEYLNV